MVVDIERQTAFPECIIGFLTLTINGKVVYTCKTLELPWRDNKRKESCIPTGEYRAVKRWSQKYGDHFHILDVPHRDMILIHAGNSYKHTKGCILIGEHSSDIDGDGVMDVSGSRRAMDRLNELITDDEFEVTIKDMIYE